ncbi:conserved hypothetical protein [Crenothrix polyspora]|uniref:Uncharacterized protein n=1 Tax=Crenothrix polyspora TaxID=360316 RepID=A0A1R4HBF1_9GAMM|nr:hypothetical protein [Crenothrix polyspora]SJM93200.1 conserved hypothetical protein [Crenothrix polyspora]
MSTEAISTVVKMLESLPESAQNQAINHLRDYLADLQDEIRWDNLYKNTQANLIAKARLAKQQIAAGHSQPLNYDDL